MSPGEKVRLRFEENMQKVAVGAKLRRRRYLWTIVKQKRWATSVELKMRCGRRTCVVHVMIDIYGPVLDTLSGLHSVTPAPLQRELVMGGA